MLLGEWGEQDNLPGSMGGWLGRGESPFPCARGGFLSPLPLLSLIFAGHENVAGYCLEYGSLFVG